jgi:AraC-like DNA-binding protein
LKKTLGFLTNADVYVKSGATLLNRLFIVYPKLVMSRMPNRTMNTPVRHGAVAGHSADGELPQGDDRRSWLDVATTDAEDAANIQRLWMPIEYDQIDAGAFAGRFQQLGFKNTLVATERQNRAVLKRHYFPADYCTVSLIRSISGRGRCGLDAFSERIVAYMPGGQDYEIVMPASEVVFFRVDQDRFLSAVDALGYDMPGGGRQTLILDNRNPGYLDDVATALVSIQHSSASNEFAALDHSYLDEAVLERLIGVLLGSTMETTRALPVSAHRITKAAHALIEDSAAGPFTVMALCKELGVSRASLQRSFLQIYGVSPLAYLRMRRLNSARRALRTAQGSDLTVAAVAMRWGFFHFARFSQDYFHQFGELPSATLGGTGRMKARSGR